MDSIPDTKNESTVQPTSECEDDDPLDPRVPVEFERLNHANEAINHLESQLDDARRIFDEYKIMSEEGLLQLEKSIGTAVAKAKNYYDARIKLRDAKEVLVKARHRFECAQALHVAAKELADASEDYIDEAEKANQNAETWNETYFHAIAKAREAEREKYEADSVQQHAEKIYNELLKSVEKLEKDFRRQINKAKPYYEMKAQINKELEFQNRKIRALENCVSEAKSEYQRSLKNLEYISNEIHEQRNQKKLKENIEKYIADINEEKLIAKQRRESIPRVSQANCIDPTIRSCLLRTETLPTGVVTAANEQESLEGNDTTQEKNNHNDQFILSSKDEPPSAVIMRTNHLKKTEHKRTHELRSSVASQSTDDEDDRVESLHVLSDEQLEHLASSYQTFSSQVLPSEINIHNQAIGQSNDIISKSLLY